jgi:hypothetical protein
MMPACVGQSLSRPVTGTDIFRPLGVAPILADAVTLLAILGAVLAAVGIAGLGLEIAHGSDIWRKGNGGIAPLVIGGFSVWHGLAEREWGVRSKPLWPTLAWLTILVAIGVALYLPAPPLAFLYAILVGIIVRFSLVANWLDRE